MADTNASARPSDSSVKQLEDDRPAPQESEFVGATLQISSETHNADEKADVEFVGPGLNRNRPGSVIGRRSVRSTSSRTSMRPGVVKSDVTAETFFSYKENTFQSAVDNISHIIKPELDGELLGAWLLTEIDHWDFEREKIVLLTTNSMFIVKFNFITKQLHEYRRIMLHIIQEILIGDFKYPNHSVMPDRQHGGIQLRWNQEIGLSFGQKWNPWCTDIPWATLAHHPIIYNPKENETVTFNVDDFFESLLQQCSKVFELKRPNERVKVTEGPIEIESYASLPSIIFNQSNLGFFRDRNGMCF